jgi:ATP-dependent phosphofructokinase / diphosphate-dependent phosphofructokinase
MHNTVRTLQELSIDSLVTIGGDDTAFSAQKVAEAAGGTLKVAHVPKTIDNDLPLPRGISTFGFQTARHVGVEIVNNLMTDAMTTRRWFIVLAMGRSAGHLAVRIGKAAGATLTVIAEEFSREQPIKLSHLVDLVDATILKRMAHGRPFGVVILSEGIALRLGQQDLQKAMPDVERDEHGHIRLGELNLDGVLADLVKERFRDRRTSGTSCDALLPSRSTSSTRGISATGRSITCASSTSRREARPGP